MPRTLAMLTDFGTEDAYAGILRGVVLSLAPEINLVDLTHEIPPGDVPRAAFELWRSYRYFPEGALFLIIVDPGVGQKRRPLAIEWEGFICLAPDNGVCTYLLVQDPPVRAVELRNPAFRLTPGSHTFHGRDIFAPAAAHLARGVAVETMGPEVGDLMQIELPHFTRDEDGLRGVVMHADRFGNLITSIGCLQRSRGGIAFDPWLLVCEGGHIGSITHATLPDGLRLPLQETFADVPVGTPFCYIGSAGLLEIGVNQGRACDLLGLGQGAHITLTNRG